MTEPLGEAPATSFLASLGPRGRRRAEPRTSIAIAGAGCALAVLGVLVIAGDTGSSDGDFNKVPGIVLSALVVAAGFVALRLARPGALATAGSVAAALGVPPLMFFLTFDQDQLPPYSTEAILIVSTIVWLAAYAIGPGRARPFFLGAGLIGAWLTLLQLTEHVFDAPFDVVSSGFEGSVGGFSDGGGRSIPARDAPDPTTLGLLSLALGAGYLLTCRWLDRRGHHGVATPFALATLPTLTAGTLLMADDLEQAGTGLLALVIGAALALHGATVGRRATAWVGGAATGIGAAVFLADMTDDATVGGMLFLAGGMALVAAGHAIAAALSEPDEMAVAPAFASVTAAPGSDAPARPTDGDDSRWAPPPEDPHRPPPPF